ncbi:MULTISPECIES: hypothetical protein [Pseudomonas]|uniref:Uncharacterized protein n=1 Tax=Pseudomonas lutea TaxID=243924 RepID=A0A9X8MHH2_9PSED|nr:MULTISPECIES: hypothetical protein [Pseudomonas]SER43300.1 hypothetical protein SAMN05216409_1216 [Pseudomonas lutea]
MDATKPLYKLAVTPSGRRLWTYMAAILEVTEMDQGKPFPLKRFFGNFQTHLDNGRIEIVSEGYRLTQTGQDYFLSRYETESSQRIERAAVEQMIISIRSGVGEGDWVAVT